MTTFNTSNFLPSVFRSVTNKRFLGATVDQLFAESVDIPINGYIGRTFAPTYKLNDNYVPEIFASRKAYQLEPEVVAKNANGEIDFATGYYDILRSITNNKGHATNHQRLFSGEIYSYDGRFDYDKFVQYYNYYWLPNGPDAVSVSSNNVPLNKTFIVTKNTDVGGYTFEGQGYHPNLPLTLARGGVYKFIVDQSSDFWIQSQVGVSGVDPNISTLSTREVFGVANNGINSGEVVFRVPLSNAQDFYTTLPRAGMPDITAGIANAAVDFQYTDIQNKLLSNFLQSFGGIDGINTPSQLQNKKIIFIGGQIDDTQ